MEVTLALLADSANVSQEGKLNVLGVFHNVNASGFPCVHPQMMLVMRFEASRAEAGQNKHLQIRLMDPDGAALGSIEADFTVPDGRPGERITMMNITPLTNTVFQRPGPHEFVIMISGETKSEVKVRVIDTSLRSEGDAIND